MEKTLVEEAIRAMMHTDRMHRHMIDEEMGSIGIHRTAHMMLMHLARNEKIPSQREMAEHFGITPAAVTGTLQNLERGGYITRNAGKDNRYNEISITEEGREVVARSREIFRRIDGGMFRGIGEEELKAYIAVLERVQNNMREMEDKN